MKFIVFKITEVHLSYGHFVLVIIKVKNVLEERGVKSAKADPKHYSNIEYKSIVMKISGDGNICILTFSGLQHQGYREG